MESGTKSHLLCHAAEGYYVPVALTQPLLDTEVGSTASCVHALVVMREERVLASSSVDITCGAYRL
jgi:hypothetical protein